MASLQPARLVDPAIFAALQQHLDDDSATRDAIRDAATSLEKQSKGLLAHLSNAASLPTLQARQEAVRLASTSLFPELRASVQSLQRAADPHPHYRFHGLWSRSAQEAVFATLLLAWRGGLAEQQPQLQPQQLPGLEPTAAALGVPGPAAAADGQDVFHLSAEEYLHGVVSLVDEVARAARTAVTLGDYTAPVAIARFVKDVHAGFGVLNLKNDSLRKRADGIKYKVRETEDVVYDLTLRGLIPRDAPA